MYLRNSRYHLERTKKRRIRFNWPLIFVLALAIVGLSYFQAFIVPTIPPVFLPTPTSTRTAASYAEDAARLFQEGKLAASISMYKQAIQVDPKNSDLYTGIARAQVFARDYDNAKTNAQNAVLRSKNAVSLAVYGWTLYHTGNLDDARQQLLNSLDMDPGSALAHAYLSFVIIDSNPNDWKVASEEARTALTISPNILESRMAMGYVYMNTGNYIEAVEEYNAAIAIHDKLSELFIMLGDCYRGLGDSNNAIDSYSRAAALDPQNPDPYSRISRTYAGDGQYGKAVQYAESAVAVDPINPRLRGLVGVMYYRNGDYANSALNLELAVSGGVVTVDGKDVMIEGIPLAGGLVAEYYWTYGLALGRLGRCSEAIPIFRLLQQALPEDLFAQQNAVAGLLMCLEITPTPTARVNP